MQTAREEVYCHETARRAVARAALHLGMENMTSEALSVTADCLLQYLQRIGQALAHSTEASGRSSAHVHVLDAVRAVELCTSPAVERLHLTTGGAAGGVEGSEHEALTPPMTNWKGLAQFLFGKDWHLEDKTGEEGQASAMALVEAQRTGGEGKVGPSAVQDNATTAVAAVGWQAPYPDEVPAFPLVTGKVANPHPFTEQEAHAALSRQVVETETTRGDEETPDTEAGEGWGDLHKTSVDDKKRKAETKDNAGEPPTKRVKIAEEDPMSEGEQEVPSEETTEASLYPAFFPPLPRAADGARRLVVDTSTDATASATSATSHPVRSALVTLGGEDQPAEQQPYWGSGWENLAVPPGRTEDKDVQPQIVPLGRASGSRVSRILEGSMDAAQMQ